MSAKIYFGSQLVDVTQSTTTLSEILQAFDVEYGYLTFHGEKRAAVTMPEEPLPSLDRDYDLIVDTHDERQREREYTEAIRTLQALGATALLDLGTSLDVTEYNPANVGPASFAVSATLLDYSPHRAPFSDKSLYTIPGAPYAIKSFVAVGEVHEGGEGETFERVIYAARVQEAKAALETLDPSDTKPKVNAKALGGGAFREVVLVEDTMAETHDYLRRVQASSKVNLTTSLPGNSMAPPTTTEGGGSSATTTASKIDAWRKRTRE